MRRTKKNTGEFSTPFTVSDRIRELAKINGWPNPDSELQAFLDYHEMSGWKLKSGLPIVSREAAFRYWLGNAKRFAKERGEYVPAPKEPVKRAKEPELSEQQKKENSERVAPLLQRLIQQFDVRKSHEKKP